MLVCIFYSGVYASDFAVNLNVSYGYGLSDFFDQSQLLLSYEGKNFAETRQNHMGFGFNIGVTIPVINRLTVVPCIGLRYGYQDYQYQELTDDTDGIDDKNTYFFRIVSGELNAIYDVISFKSDWYLSVMLGLTYSHFRADEDMLEDEQKFWGFHAGLGMKLLHLKHFGFQIFAVYETPFDAGLISYLNTFAGILYRF